MRAAELGADLGTGPSCTPRQSSFPSELSRIQTTGASIPASGGAEPSDAQTAWGS